VNGQTTAMSNYQSPHVCAKANKKKSNSNNLSSFLIAHFLAPAAFGRRVY